MKPGVKNNGSALLITIFLVALLSATVIGVMQMTTEEIQLMRNHIYAVNAVAVAEAGLNNAFSELRDDSSWNTGFTDKTFGDDSYTVTVTGALPILTVESTAATSAGFAAKVSADITVASGPPHTIRIDHFRINQ